LLAGNPLGSVQVEVAARAALREFIGGRQCGSTPGDILCQGSDQLAKTGQAAIAV
jgi:hypothetical protein